MPSRATLVAMIIAAVFIGGFLTYTLTEVLDPIAHAIGIRNKFLGGVLYVTALASGTMWSKTFGSQPAWGAARARRREIARPRARAAPLAANPARPLPGSPAHGRAAAR